MNLKWRPSELGESKSAGHRSYGWQRHARALADLAAELERQQKGNQTGS